MCGHFLANLFAMSEKKRNGLNEPVWTDPAASQGFYKSIICSFWIKDSSKFGCSFLLGKYTFLFVSYTNKSVVIPFNIPSVTGF